MVTFYVLIVISTLSNYGVREYNQIVTFQEFTSKETCEAASRFVQQASFSTSTR